MRNFIGALCTFIMGTTMSVIILGTTPPAYTAPFNSIWFLLVGSEQLYLFRSVASLSVYFPLTLVWLVMGAIGGVFSTSRWNTIRTAVWIAVFVTVVTLMSMLIQDDTLWLSPDRNYQFVIIFIGATLSSLLTLPTAIPIVMVVSWLKQETDLPPPEKIETVCHSCGAIFKSNPLICSQCGSVLRKSEDS